MQKEIRPVIRYPGAKFTITDWILSWFPAHTSYLDPFLGSGTVFFAKSPVVHEVINDIDDQVVNLFRVIRDHCGALTELLEMTPWSRAELAYCNAEKRTGNPVEDARRFVVRCWQTHVGNESRSASWRNGGTHGPEQLLTHTWRGVPDRIRAVAERLRYPEIENRPALDVIARYGTAETLIYADPPYPKSTRNGRFYVHDAMTDTDHRALLDALDAHPGPVVLSGYACTLYDDRLRHWTRKMRVTQAEKGQKRTEILWLNPVCVERLGYGPLFAQEVT